LKPTLLVLALFITTSVKAQNISSAELSADYGELILHSQDIRPIGPSSPYSFGLGYSRWLLKQKNWERCHCFPRLGVNLSYQNLDNPAVLGEALTAYAYLEPWYQILPRTFFNLRAAAGYSWLSKPYDAETNPLNLSYSMPLTPYIMVGAGLGYQFSDEWRASGQIRYNHNSNGGVREPNKGLNYPSVNLELSYSWNPIAFERKEKIPFSEMKKQRFLSATAFVAGKSIDRSGVTYAVPGLELSYSQQFGRTSAFTAGLEFINNLAYRKEIEKQGLETDHKQVALVAGHRFLLGDFSFGQQIGVYLYRPYDVKPDWYQRYSLMWFPFKSFGVGTALKAHGHVAELLDFRLSYRLHF